MPSLVARLDSPRPPIAAVAAGVAAGLLAVAALPLFRGYVRGVRSLVGTVGPGGPGVFVSLAAAALVGLSMNFLPCNLPVVLSLLPATAREESRGAVLSRTALYAAGAVAVLGTLGVVLGSLGDRLVPLVRSYPAAGPFVALVVIGGVGLLSVVWGLREFGVVALPAVSVLSPVTDRLRRAADGRDDPAGYVLLGAVYGGTAGGCPLPTYHLLLLWVVLAASPSYGAVLLGTYVLGRIAPVAALGVVFPRRRHLAADLFGGRYETLRTVNGTLLVGGGSLLLTFTAVRALVVV